MICLNVSNDKMSISLPCYKSIIDSSRGGVLYTVYPKKFFFLGTKEMMDIYRRENRKGKAGLNL